MKPLIKNHLIVILSKGGKRGNLLYHDKVKVTCLVHREEWESYFGFLKKRGCKFCRGKVWSKYSIIKEAKKYKTKTEWNKNSPGSQEAAVNMGIYKECCKHMKVLRLKNISKKECQKVAKKYSYRNEFRKNDLPYYTRALKMGWLEGICKHMKRPTSHKLIWTLENLKEAALSFTNRKEFSLKLPGAYDRALKINCLEDICRHMKRPPIHNLKFSKDKILESIKKYTTYKEWKLENPGEYRAATSMKLLTHIKCLF